MCKVCIDFERRADAAKVSEPYGDIAQLVERFHGMEEVPGSIPGISTGKVGRVGGARVLDQFFQPLFDSFDCVGHTLGGLVAGEGSFRFTTKQPPRSDGSLRLRFVFEISMARRDRPLLAALQQALGVGSLRDRPPRKLHWQPTSTFIVGSLRAHHTATIPFFERYLPRTAKYEQFTSWRQRMDEHERAHPNRWGKGPSRCAIAACNLPVRGRGLCRVHYYRATGY